jgi:hypothetical protein
MAQYRLDVLANQVGTYSTTSSGDRLEASKSKYITGADSQPPPAIAPVILTGVDWSLSIFQLPSG